MKKRPVCAPPLVFRPAAGCGLLLLLASAAPGAAQETAPEAELQELGAIDRIFGFVTPETPGCVVGVSQRGKVLVSRAYGLADLERGVPLTPRTAFDIGSAQKQFVAAAILLLVEDGRLSLSDDVREHLPELPDYGHTVTVDHLLTHTSGIRDWTVLQPLAEEGADVLELILRQRGLNFVPGEEWSYSSSGYVLLKEIVGRVSETSFADFARERLFEPLGMTSTAYVADILQGTRERALAYRRAGAGWEAHMRLGNERGGGAVISSATDLLIWNDALTSGRLGALVTETLEAPATLNNGRQLSYARGLKVNLLPGDRLVSHSGGAAGYSTWLGRLTENELSIVVLCNFEPASASQLAESVADVFLPPAAPDAQPAGPVAAPGVEVAGRQGLYFDERTGAPLRLTVDGGELVIAGGTSLVPVSDDRFRPPRPSLFYRSEDEFELTFLSDDELELASMEGETTRFRRARPWTPSEADLHAVAGRYESEDLGQVFEILPGTKSLVFRVERDPQEAIELEPVERDAYMHARSPVLVRFRRDAGGEVTGLDYGHPALRKLPFTRETPRPEAKPDGQR